MAADELNASWFDGSKSLSPVTAVRFIKTIIETFNLR